VRGKKTGGRQVGTPNKATAEIRALAQSLAPAALAELARLASEATSEAARVAACVHLLDRAYDKSPSAARNWLKTIRGLLQFTVASGLREHDPSIGIKLPRQKSDGIHTWSESEIKQFETAHPMGTKPRLALGLLLFTAQRRGDVVRMGRQHIRNGALQVRQDKTGAVLEIPIHSELGVILDATPSAHLTLLTTKFGKPFTAAGFGNWFREQCYKAGLPRNCSAHGLRKAACRRLAEAGCTVKQIAAISGHRSLSEVQRYTAAADQALLARDAMRTLEDKAEHPLANRGAS
jgi:integrase